LLTIENIRNLWHHLRTFWTLGRGERSSR